MRPSSMLTCVLATVGPLASFADASARTLVLTAAVVDSPQLTASDVRVALDERTGAGSLRIEAGRVDVPLLGLAGRLAWHCPLRRDDSAALACAGPVHVVGRADQVADLEARVAAGRVELALARAGSRVTLSLPFAGSAAFSASLQQVPAGWLEAAVARLWKGGELRHGVFDAQATLHADGHLELQYRADGLGFTTRDGTLAGDGLTVAGTLDSTRAGQDRRIVAGTRFSGGGALRVGTMQVALPDTAIDSELDATAHEDGLWDIARFAWHDPGTLEFEAGGVLQPAALAPLRGLAVQVARARLPQASQRYAKELLAAHGLGALALKGDLAADIRVDANGPQRIAVDTRALDVEDRTLGLVVSGLAGGIDWSASGERPARTLAWRAIRIRGVMLGRSSARWQSRDGALHLLGSLRAKILGGEIELGRSVLQPLSAPASFATAFALRGAGYDSADGTLAVAHLAADGEIRFAAVATGPHVSLDATLHGGEALAGTAYVKLPSSAVRLGLDAAFGGERWRIGRFDWSDPGVLELGASGELGSTGTVFALQIALRNTQLRPALQRYAQAWLASKGYARLVAAGSLSGALRYNENGLRQFSLAAHAIDVRDGAGRFSFGGIDGGVDWDADRDMPATSLGWKAIELFAIPLGPARAQLQSRDAAIVLAQPLAVDVLGGQLRLEKLSLQPRSPRGQRYAGAFAIAGIQMPQLSAALGWPRFGGSLSGGIPEIEFSGDRIELHGGLDLYVFDGHLGVSGMTLERPFGVAPSLAADVHFENLDLDQVTSAFSFGGMSGRLAGTIGGLRLVDWSPVAFDAWLHADRGGRMSYKAVDDLTAIGGGGGLSGSLQTTALKIFDTFGYRRLGLRCALRDEVCAMGGIEPVPAAAAAGGADSSADGYTIVEGSGIPRITIVGHRRRVDWPTLVRRLQGATQGQGPVIR